MKVLVFMICIIVLRSVDCLTDSKKATSSLESPLIKRVNKTVIENEAVERIRNVSQIPNNSTIAKMNGGRSSSLTTSDYVGIVLGVGATILIFCLVWHYFIRNLFGIANTIVNITPMNT